MVLFHAGVRFAPGGFVGVDVFFVLSGYLITGLLVKEVERTGTIDLAAFYGRRARRLLPLSVLVLLATVAATMIAVSPLDRETIGGDVRAAALYVANWSYAASATEYMASTDRSPVLHFWSLSVEEQFYFAWPVIVLAVGARPGRQTNYRRRIAIALALVGLGSFALSVATSASHGPFAYFGLHTRAWELSLGAGLALARPPLERPSHAVARAVGWLGFGAIVSAAVLLDRDTVYPGFAAAWPALGTVAILASGSITGSAVAGIGWAPVRYLGRLSYAWYLWHWPCLIIAGDLERAVTGSAEASDRGVLVAILVSLGLAISSHHLIEQPVRRSRWLGTKPRSLALGACLTLVALLAAGWASWPSAPQPRREGTLVMTPAMAREDKPRGEGACYAKYDASDAPAPAECLFGDRRGVRAVALIGDSHADQWLPALEQWATLRHRRLYFWAKPSCPIADVGIWLAKNHGPYDSCASWRAAVLDRLRAVPNLDAIIVGRSNWYQALLVTSTGDRATPGAVGGLWRQGFEQVVSTLERISPRVVVLRAIPRSPGDVPACLSEDPSTPERCAFRYDQSDQPDRAVVAEERVVADHHPGVSFVDLNPEICPAGVCSVISREGAIKYRDVHHLTATYVQLLGEVLGARVDAAIARSPVRAPTR